MIIVRQTGDREPLAFRVELDGTPFDVTLARGDLDRLADGRSAAEVVTAAFQFLLDREPKEAILRTFDLSVISRYFPAFERELSGYMDRLDEDGRT